MITGRADLLLQRSHRSLSATLRLLCLASFMPVGQLPGCDRPLFRGLLILLLLLTLLHLLAFFRLFFANLTSSLVTVNSTLLAYALVGLAVAGAAGLALYYLYLQSASSGAGGYGYGNQYSYNEYGYQSRYSDLRHIAP